jgi:hypothetical protein
MREWKSHIKEVIMNSKEFSLKIENIVKEKRISYMDAVFGIVIKTKLIQELYHH